jgi:hypothetical protein
MDLQKFRSCLSQSEPPENLSLAVQALWWDAKGDWDKAHACAQAQDDADGAWVHAYLHRKELAIDPMSVNVGTLGEQGRDLLLHGPAKTFVSPGAK